MTRKTRRKVDAALKAKIALEGDGGRSGAALRGAPEPDLCVEEATSGTGGPGLLTRVSGGRARRRANARLRSCTPRLDD